MPASTQVTGRGDPVPSHDVKTHEALPPSLGLPTADGGGEAGETRLGTPLAAVASTLVDVIVRNRDPAEQDVPWLLLSPGDRET